MIFQMLLVNDKLLLDKTRKVIESCETSKQLEGALNFLIIVEARIATGAGLEECLALHACIAMKMHRFKKERTPIMDAKSASYRRMLGNLPSVAK